MMCKPCREAGDYVTKSRESGQAISTNGEAWLIAKHAECPNFDSCTCQHRVATRESDVEEVEEVSHE